MVVTWTNHEWRNHVTWNNHEQSIYSWFSVMTKEERIPCRLLSAWPPAPAETRRRSDVHANSLARHLYDDPMCRTQGSLSRHEVRPEPAPPGGPEGRTCSSGKAWLGPSVGLLGARSRILLRGPTCRDVRRLSTGSKSRLKPHGSEVCSLLGSYMFFLPGFPGRL